MSAPDTRINCATSLPTASLMPVCAKTKPPVSPARSWRLKGKIIVAGEITCDGKVDIVGEVREVLRKVGYNPWKFTVFVFVHKQSKDIDAGVSTALEALNGSEERYSSIGAGDQGTVYGYATNETREMLPLPLVLAHRICKRVDAYPQGKQNRKGILPDGKAQGHG